MPRPWRRASFLFFFPLISFVWANYYIDDTNTTLSYTPSALWNSYYYGGQTLKMEFLPNGTNLTIDASIVAACSANDTCLLTIPFTGWSIGTNASITVDGAYAQTNVLSAPPAPNYEKANVSMFDVQQLTSASHVLNLAVNNFSGNDSLIMFDYAYVNESRVTSLMTTTSTTATTAASIAASTSAPHSSSSASNTDIGAIVGGVVGGIALVATGLFAFLWIRRRRGHPPEMIDLHAGSSFPPPHTVNLFTDTTETWDPYNGYNPSMNGDLTTSYSTKSSRLIPPVHSRFDLPAVQRTQTTLSTSQDILTPFTASPSSDSRVTRGKTGSELSNDAAYTPSSPPQVAHSPSTPRQDTPPLLTDEQADFINSLHRNNVPAAAIARVMERMLVDQHAGIQEWKRETKLARTNTTMTAPPSYDLVAERGGMVDY
ncbi:hypothetical protein HD554DRAFT_2094678 [Boletus coccyginus]|nr:hypothetical protein HD554DRAFT_2094678 [Boletus coccyginus]